MPWTAHIVVHSRALSFPSLAVESKKATLQWGGGFSLGSSAVCGMQRCTRALSFPSLAVDGRGARGAWVSAWTALLHGACSAEHAPSAFPPWLLRAGKPRSRGVWVSAWTAQLHGACTAAPLYCCLDLRVGRRHRLPPACSRRQAWCEGLEAKPPNLLAINAHTHTAGSLTCAKHRQAHCVNGRGNGSIEL